MSAKLLNVFGDENPDFNKQIGCMTGILQVFDRHHLLTGRRFNGHNHKRLPEGNTRSNSSKPQAETKAGSPRTSLEKNLSKSLNENQRISVESSRASFSSSSCSSSFSSLECNKSTQQEPSLYERTTFPEKPLKASTVLQGSDTDTRPLRTSPSQDTQDPCAPSRQFGNFRDVVKDSIYKDNTGLSVKTSNKEEVKKLVKHLDSPRPLPLSKSMDGSYVIGINEKPKMSVDLKESLRVLAKLKEAPWHFSEDKEPPRPSYESKDGSVFSLPKEAPRFSYDGREVSCSSLDSRENSKCSTRFRELPRLSLDSRQSSMRHLNFRSKSNSGMEELENSEASQRTYGSLSLQQDLENHKRPTSVVAKLMGLEAMPLSSGVLDQLNLNKRCTTKDNRKSDGLEKINPRSKSLKMEENKHEWLSCSPKSSLKESITLQSRTAEAVLKPVSNSRLPIETAPWRQQTKSNGTHKMVFGTKGNTRQQHESVYSEIERKLKELEFKKSNKDLRALKHILDAIQAKGVIETKKDEGRLFEASGDNYSDLDHNLRTTNKQNARNSHPHYSLMKGANPSRPSESPIVIMKPAKLVKRSAIPASSVVHFDGLSTIHRVHTGDPTDARRVPIHNQIAKEQNSKLRFGEPSGQGLLPADKKSGRQAETSSQKAHEQVSRGSSRRHQSTRENNGSSVKTSGSFSPRLQQKKLDLERKSRPPLPSSESAKQQKQSTTRHISESVSPRGKFRPRSDKAQQASDQSEITSEIRNLSHHDNESSLRSDSNVNLMSQLDEVTSADRSAELDPILFIQPRCQNPTDRAVNNIVSSVQEKKALQGFGEDTSTELAVTSLEQPSPVSVLDASFYRDDQPLSPANKMANLFRGDDTHNSDIPRGVNWKTVGPDSQLPNNPSCDLNSLSHKKLETIENLLQKLRQLSSDKEASATDHIASLCENNNPDHRYVSEVLLASGLLLKDLGGGPTGPVPVQLHKSGYPINPDLFLVLEQTKTGILTNPEQLHESTVTSKPDPEKLRRRLIFDAVNEILIQKLELSVPGSLPKNSTRAGKLTGRIPTGKQLLKELCLEIDRLQACCHGSVSSDEDDDSLKLILREDVACQSEGWTDFDKDVSGWVLDMERSIFKDLIDEVVGGESAASGLPAKPTRSRRQLFAK